MQAFKPVIDYQAIFLFSPNPYLLLNNQLTIVEVNEAYLTATMVKRDVILGKNIFEVFPDNPADLTATGTKNLRASLTRVLKNKTFDTMALQKYDIKHPETGKFEERYWNPINVPVLGEDGEVKYILHHAEDVTEFVRLQQSGTEQSRMTAELRFRTERMGAEIFRGEQQIQEVNEKLRMANQVLEEQQQAILELSTPVLEVANGLLLMPLIGIIDVARAQRITENLLPVIREKRTKMVVIDISGVPNVDATVAEYFFQLLSVTRLMGTGLILTGFSGKVAKLLTGLGLDLSRLNIKGDLQSGLEEAHRQLQSVP